MLGIQRQLVGSPVFVVNFYTDFRPKISRPVVPRSPKMLSDRFGEIERFCGKKRGYYNQKFHHILFLYLMLGKDLPFVSNLVAKPFNNQQLF